MEMIIFLKAIGNLLFTAILFIAVIVTSAFSVLKYMLQGCKPAADNLMSALQARLANRELYLPLGKKVLSQKKL
jgi:galactitol-specific phosphotransferase system IIC component